MPLWESEPVWATPNLALVQTHKNTSGPLGKDVLNALTLGKMVFGSKITSTSQIQCILNTQNFRFCAYRTHSKNTLGPHVLSCYRTIFYSCNK